MDTKEYIESLTPFIGDCVTRKWQELINDFGYILDERNIKGNSKESVRVIQNISSLHSDNLKKIMSKFIEEAIEQFKLYKPVKVKSIESTGDLSSDDDCVVKFIYDNEKYTIGVSSPSRGLGKNNIDAEAIRKMVKLYYDVIDNAEGDNMKEYKVKINLSEIREISNDKEISKNLKNFGITGAKLNIKIKGRDREEAEENLIKAIKAFGFEPPYSKGMLSEMKEVKNKKEKEEAIELD